MIQAVAFVSWDCPGEIAKPRNDEEQYSEMNESLPSRQLDWGFGHTERQKIFDFVFLICDAAHRRYLKVRLELD